MGNLYVIIDPTVSKFCGISNYSKYASELIRKHGINVSILKRAPDEDINTFRKKVLDFVTKESEKILMVEAPETGASTLLLKSNIKTHIRIHGSKNLINLIEFRKQNTVLLEEEKKVLNLAYKISAPSYLALRASQNIFPIENCFIFPNPGSKSFYKIPKSNDILIVASPQIVKGIHLIDKIISKIPENFSIIIVSPKLDCQLNNKKYGNNIQVFNDASYQEIQDFLAKSKVLLMPSIFETYSMLALEALSKNTYVSCWEDIGILDAISKPFIHANPNFNINKLVSSCLTLCSDYRKFDSKAIIDDLNNQFVNGFNKILSNEIPINFKKKNVQNFIISSRYKKVIKAAMFKYKLTSFQRKFKKFIRDPKVFFIDSKLNLYLKKIKVRLNTNVRSHIEDYYYDNIYTNINIVDFSKVMNGDIRKKSLFLLTGKNNDFYQNVFLKKVKNLNDILLSKENFFILLPEADKQLDDIAQILKKNKVHEVEKIQNIICFKESWSIARNLRALNYLFRITLILKPNESISIEESSSIDILICPLNFNINKLVIRRVLRYPNVKKYDDFIVESILRVLRESGPKDHEMFLQIYGDTELNLYLEDIETNQINGLIFQSTINSKDDFSDQNTFDDLINSNFIAIESIFFSESTYWKYKTIIENAINNSDWQNLIKLTLADSIKYKVISNNAA